MSATTTLPAPAAGLSPGDHLDIAAECPARVVTWDADGTCWGLVRTRRRSARPGFAVYQAVAPIVDEEGWMDGDDQQPPPEPEPACDRQGPPPPRPPAPPVTGDGDPVDLVRATFGDVEVVYSPDELARLATKVLNQYRQRDPDILDVPAWARLATAVDGTAGPSELAVAVRGVLDWCAETDPTKLTLGGWKSLLGQVDGFERRDPPVETRLVPHAANVRRPAT